MGEELWLPVVGWEGFYEISNLGRVKTLQRKGVLKERIILGIKQKRGYLAVVLSKNGKTKMYTIHRLVAKAFIVNTENKLCVNHINGIKTDNRLSNLEWATHKENLLHAWNFNLRSLTEKQKNYFKQRGIDRRKPVCLYKDGVFIKRFNSVNEAKRESGHSPEYSLYGKNINNCKFIFKFEEV